MALCDVSTRVPSREARRATLLHRARRERDSHGQLVAPRPSFHMTGLESQGGIVGVLNSQSRSVF